MKVLLTLALLLSTAAFAQIEEFHVIRLTGADELTSFTQQATTAKDEQSGLSLAIPEAVAAAATPEEDLEENGFNLGDHVVLCFRPAQTMYIRVLDIRPQGEQHQLYPEEGSVQVEGGQMYCAGDENSDIQFHADEESGVGEGVLWIAGSESAEALSQSDDESGPDAMQGLDLPTKGLYTVDRSPEPNIYEAYLMYEVQEQSDAQEQSDEQAEEQSQEQTIEVTSSCLSGAVQVSYLQQIALTEDARLVVTLDGQESCEDQSLQPSQLTYTLNGQQVPLPISLTCSPESTLTFDLFENDLKVFSGTTSCSDLHNDGEILLSPEAVEESEADDRLGTDEAVQALFNNVFKHAGLLPDSYFVGQFKERS